MPNCNLQKALADFDVNPLFRRSIIGAASAWRGFELQTLYICSRILSSDGTLTEFWPERAEDLLIHQLDQDGSSLELVQVKAKTTDLTLSDIASRDRDTHKGKADSLFEHVRHYVERGFDVRARVVVFGKLGSELERFSDGDPQARTAVAKRVTDMYGEEMGSFASMRLEFEEIDEMSVRQSLEAAAEGRVELSAWPKALLHHLTSKVRDCSLSRQPITKGEIEQDIVDLGLKLAGLSGFARQYGVTVLPLAQLYTKHDDGQSGDEYRHGVNAKPEHIVNGLDVVRQRWMDELERALDDSQVVLVRGASGQGKSTLCFRYLYDRVPIDDCFLISEIESLEVAADICSFLVALSESRSDRPQYAYVDGASEMGWVWLAEQLVLRANPNLKLIVSIREEDLSRVNVTMKQFRWAEVALALEEDEAREIFSAYGETQFPSFEESWMAFGEGGPLMEYTYSLSTGSTLRTMLSGQIGRLVDSWEDSQLFALYIASLIGSEGLETEIAALCESSGCLSMGSFVRAVEREHLLVGTEKGMIGPLHPYRSSIIAEILEPYIFREANEIAAALVKCAASSCGSLLVALCGRTGKEPSCAEELVTAAGGSWYRLSEILKYALWADARHVYEKCGELRAEIASQGLSAWLLFADGGGITKYYKWSTESSIFSFIPDETRRLAMEELCKRAKQYQIDYRQTRDVLASIDLASMPLPSTSSELSSAGFVLSQYVACDYVDRDVANAACDFAVQFEPQTRSTSAELDFALGIQLCGARLSDSAYRKLAGAINKAHSLVWSNSNQENVDVVQIPSGEGHNLNDELVSALIDYRMLYPSAELYNGIQLGTDAFIPKDRMPPTEKHIPQKNLPIHWLNLADILFNAMCSYDDVPSDWREVEDIIVRSYENLRKAATEMTKWLNKCYEKGVSCVVSKELSKHVVELANLMEESWITLDTPKSSRDPMGFKSLISPMDRRLVKNADREAVDTSKPSDNPLAKTGTVVTDSTTLAQRLMGVMVSVVKNDRGRLDTDIRIAVSLISGIVKNLAISDEEIRRVFRESLIPADTESCLVVLSEGLAHLSAFGVRMERGVAYASKRKANELINARALFAQGASLVEGVQAEVYERTLVMRVDLEKMSQPTLDMLLGHIVRSQYADFDRIENITEYFLFPHYVEPIELDLFYGGEFFTTKGISGFALVRLSSEDSDYSVVYQPVLKPSRPIPTPTDSGMIALQTTLAIDPIAQLVSSVKVGIRAKDAELTHLDNTVCNEWVGELREGVVRLFELVRANLDELGLVGSVRDADLDVLESTVIESFDIRSDEDPVAMAENWQCAVKLLLARAESS